MLTRLLLLLVVVAGLAPLRAQNDGPVKMEPEFCFAFPVTKVNKDVTVKFPIFINPGAIVKPGTVLRVIYILKDGAAIDVPVDLDQAHKSDQAQAYSRASNSGGTAAPIPRGIAHEIEGYRRTEWGAPQNFVMAIAQYPTDAMHLIYSTTNRAGDLSDERFSFFDGCFIGLPDGKVTVLAVEIDSKAARSGIKAGDEFVSVGGKAVGGDLKSFATAYSATKATAKENETTSFAVTIRSKGQVRTVQIPMPAKFKSSLMNGNDFFNK